MKKQNIIILLILAGALFIAGTAYSRQRQKAQDIVDDSAVQAVAANFTSHMQKVTLSAPDADAEMTAVYSPYVEPSLIAKWQADHSSAPGRKVSSPWPTSLNITAVTKKTSTYVVQGMVSEVTSQEAAHGGIAAQFPVTIKLSKSKDTWLIHEYDPGIETNFLPKTPTTTKSI